MESPVVLDKPPEYHGKDDRGFPFDEEEGSGAWSELASRHPDIAARLRQHPSTWARKRRPSSQDNDDFGESFTGFDRFPFDDIPPEFREHFPSHWNRRFGTREEAAPQPQTSQSPPQQHTAATQTEHHPPPETSGTQHTHLPQYGLRNTVDLGQKSAADPSLVDADDRNQRSVSAPPESRNTNHSAKMSGQNHQDSGPHAEQPQTQSKVRNIPIFVEGRDQPVINETVDHTPHFGETKPTYVPQQPPLDSSYFTEEGPTTFHHPPNFSRSFGTPFGKPYRQGQPFAQQKVYPQSATSFARGASPQRSQSPKPQPHEEYIKVPVHHEPSAPKPQPQARSQQPKPQQQQKPQPPQQQKPQPPPPQQAQPPPPQQPPKQPTPPPQPQSNDPITMILAIQTDVLNLMNEVENFTGTKKDKRYLFLDEMLTRNLIKLDNIETEGKENIRNARKEAIRCIEKCIAVLEAKAEKGSQLANQSGGDTEMNAAEQAAEQSEQKNAENGEVEEMKEPPTEEVKEEAEQPKQQSETVVPPAENKETPQVTDTRPEDNTAGDVDKKPNKATKNVQKDKSKDKANVDSKDEKSVEAMQLDDKGDNAMEVDGGASQN